jgi:hypothetical protein
MTNKLTEGNIIYCTYFDKGFLMKGLALHESLIRYQPNAKIWILALDEYTEIILKKMKLKGTSIVALKDFEDKSLLAAKKTRHLIEYYWTCTPAWIKYILTKSPETKYVVYLDGDLFFYSNPDAGVYEIKDKSILAVEHRFPKGREGMAEGSGRFNVAFNVFKNDGMGLKCLERWRKQCLEWCYWKTESGKLGDQKYLDEWPNLYSEQLSIPQNKGLDTAPWNVSQYKVTTRGGKIFVDEDKLICYHFHQFKILAPNHYSRVMGYTLSNNVVKYIYEPYESELKNQYEKILKYDGNFKINKTESDNSAPKVLPFANYLSPVYWWLKGFFHV